MNRIQENINSSLLCSAERRTHRLGGNLELRQPVLIHRRPVAAPRGHCRQREALRDALPRGRQPRAPPAAHRPPPLFPRRERVNGDSSGHRAALYINTHSEETKTTP